MKLVSVATGRVTTPIVDLVPSVGAPEHGHHLVVQTTFDSGAVGQSVIWGFDARQLPVYETMMHTRALVLGGIDVEDPAAVQDAL